ncbi:Flagellar basal-body rod protein FlgG [Gemmata sp. SH-PL17]|uniref:flagellar hook-basal body protein n=1 Tax=Gemmata sp. SH-PL17 TaxID=1630693 RepID=UPI00078E346F|nr:flagellar hook basal-body protein [Gemmata sp. SH-PL17]AMV25015.1 Flagellar basal-body rod protein FlgG [Gemmata sp. SH-PL17]
MIRGMYSAASALVVASEQQEVTAHNLAHSSTPGYRERGLVFETFDRVLGRTAEPTGDITGVRTVQAYHDFRPGALQQTNHRYDLALGDPDRFFVLAGPNGPVYTRNGCFFPDAAGRLVSQGGYALQSDNGEITVPPNTNRFIIASDGTITADGQPLGRLQMVRFANPQQLTAAGPTLYTAQPGSGLQDAPGLVSQGYRESSNVHPADAMVRLIIGARYYDAAQRSLRSLAETIQLNTRPQNA